MKSRRPYQWVTEWLALGGAVEDEEVPLLLQDGITHVLDCRSWKLSTPPYAGAGIEYRQYGIADDGQPKPDEWFFRGIDFAWQARRSRRSKLLVHCKFGMSRGPSMAFAILRAFDIPATEAVERIHTARSVARVTYQEDAERAVSRWKRPR